MLALLVSCRSACKVAEFTVTEKEQLVLCPQLSLAEQVTVVVPIGKVLPLGGLQLTNGGGLQPPVAELVKKTGAPFELVVVTVIFDEQFNTRGGRVTITEKEQLVLCPQLSLAEQVTMVVPMGKVLPLGGLQLTNGGGLHPPVAELVKKTVAPLALVADTVIFDEQFRTSGGYCGGLTVMVNEQLVLCPQLSLALQKTVFVPIGKVLPLGGLQARKGGGLHPPLAELVKKTVAPFELVAVTVMFDEQFNTSGGRVTMTEKEQLVLCPQLSLAEQVTMVVPIGKVLPLGGLQLRKGGGLHPPLAELVKKTTAPF